MAKYVLLIRRSGWLRLLFCLCDREGAEERLLLWVWKVGEGEVLWLGVFILHRREFFH